MIRFLYFSDKQHLVLGIVPSKRVQRRMQTGLSALQGLCFEADQEAHAFMCAAHNVPPIREESRAKDVAIRESERL